MRGSIFLRHADAHTSGASFDLEPVLGPTGMVGRWLRAWRTVWAFAWGFAERYRRLADPDRFRSTLDGAAHWQQLTTSSSGAILVTAHIGPWETGAQFGAIESQRRVHVVHEQEMDPRAQEFVRDILSRPGPNYVAHFSGTDPTLSLTLAQALKNGDIVALQGDRPRAGGRTVVVSVCGRPWPLPIGPAVLAADRRCIFPIFNFREGRFQMRVVIRPPVTVAKTTNRTTDIADALHRLGRKLNGPSENGHISGSAFENSGATRLPALHQWPTRLETAPASRTREFTAGEGSPYCPRRASPSHHRVKTSHRGWAVPEVRKP